MKVLSLVLLAIFLGAGLGYAATIVEFGFISVPPRLASSGGGGASDGGSGLEPPPSGSPLPKIVVDNATYDFGVMGQDGTGNHTFVIRNEGEGPLRLAIGDVPCKCTVGELSKELVEPGDAAELAVEFTPGNMEGRFSRSIQIKHNDLLEGRLLLTVTGNIRPIVSVNPSQFLAYNLTPETDKHLDARFYAYHNDALEFTGHHFSDASLAQFFDVSYDPIALDEIADDAAMVAYQIHLDILPGMPAGRFNQTLVIETNDEEKPTIPIEIIGNVTASLSLAGSGFDSDQGVLNFGTVVGGASAERKMALLARGEDRQIIELSVAETLPASLQVEFGEPQSIGVNGSLVRTPITVRVPDNAPAASFYGTDPDQMGYVVLKTNSPEQPELKFYVRLVIGD